jgi:hypothetical protein
LRNIAEGLQKSKGSYHEFIDFLNAETDKVHQPKFLFRITPILHLGANFSANMFNCGNFFYLINFAFLREDFEQNSNALLDQKLLRKHLLLRKFEAESIADTLNSWHIV